MSSASVPPALAAAMERLKRVAAGLGASRSRRDGESRFLSLQRSALAGLRDVHRVAGDDGYGRDQPLTPLVPSCF